LIGRRQAQRDIRVAAPEFVKPGAYCLTPDGRLAVSEGQELLVIEATVSATAAKRIRGLMAIRDAARRLLHVQHVTADDSRLGSYRVALNVAYDGFVARSMAICMPRPTSWPSRAILTCHCCFLWRSFDPEGGTAEKADIFTEERWVLFARSSGVRQPKKRC
jgi:hypothetical protein